MEATIMMMQHAMGIVKAFVNWMFSTQFVPGFSVGVVLFGSTLIMMGTRFITVLLAKSGEKKDG